MRITSLEEFEYLAQIEEEREDRIRAPLQKKLDNLLHFFEGLDQQLRGEVNISLIEHCLSEMGDILGYYDQSKDVNIQKKD